MKLWCLHGNLQHPSVWNLFENTWHINSPNGVSSPLELECPNLWKNDATSFEQWTHQFCNQVQQHSRHPQWLMGYSLGGRLALHATIAQPNLWAGVIIIGAHPGFASVKEKEQQQMADNRWGQRFLEEPWNELLTTWDALPVFGNRPNTSDRPEHMFSRAQIAANFTNYSKGRQHYLTPMLSQLTSPPILFISGNEDEKYSSIGASLAEQCQSIQHVTIPKACHRVPWENPEAFTKTIQVFLDKTS
ncbi:MAG: alpha/beta fold hydrolase [Rhodothermales bacterium]